VAEHIKKVKVDEMRALREETAQLKQDFPWTYEDIY
jgi:hypothetical protein